MHDHARGVLGSARRGNNPRPAMTRGAQFSHDDEKLSACGKSKAELAGCFVDGESLGLQPAQGLESLGPSISHLGRRSVRGMSGGIDAHPAVGQWRFAFFDRDPIGGHFAPAQKRKHTGIRFATREKGDILVGVNRTDGESVWCLAR